MNKYRENKENSESRGPTDKRYSRILELIDSIFSAISEVKVKGKVIGHVGWRGNRVMFFPLDLDDDSETDDQS